MLELKNVKVSYDNYHMLYDFAIDEGDILAVIGPSGVGKTTLLNIIAGFVCPVQGTLIYNNINFSKLSPAMRPVSYIFQEGNLFPHLTVAENIAIGINPNLSLNIEQYQKLDVCLNKMGLINYRNKLPDQLSGGQKQRVSLGRALLRNKPIVLLDEPFTALDPATKYEFIDLIKSVQKKENLTIILVTHDLLEVRLIATKVAFLNAGQVELFGRYDEIVASKQANFRRYFALNSD